VLLENTGAETGTVPRAADNEGRFFRGYDDIPDFNRFATENGYRKKLPI